MDIFDYVSKEAYKAGEFVVKKAVLAKDYTVATWNAAEMRAEIDEHYKAIGKLIYEGQTTEKDTSQEVEAHVQALEKLFSKLHDKEEERQSMRHRKLCPDCEKPIAKSVSYCPHCGAKVK